MLYRNKNRPKKVSRSTKTLSKYNNVHCVQVRKNNNSSQGNMWCEIKIGD